MSEGSQNFADRSSGTPNILPNTTVFDGHPGEQKTSVAEGIKIRLIKLAPVLSFTPLIGKPRRDTSGIF
jgi:hypothetical protein